MLEIPGKREKTEADVEMKGKMRRFYGRLLHKFGYEGFTSCFCHWIHWLSDRSEKEQDKIGASDSYWER